MIGEPLMTSGNLRTALRPRLRRRVQEYAIVLMARPCRRGVPSAVEEAMADSITARDLVAVRGLLDLDLCDESQHGLPWHLMSNPRELFHCDYVELDRTNTAAQQFVFEQRLSDVQECIEACGTDAADPVTAEYWKLYWLTSACNYPDRLGDIAHVTTDRLSVEPSGEPADVPEFGLPDTRQYPSSSRQPGQRCGYCCGEAGAETRERYLPCSPCSAAPQRRGIARRAPSSGTGGVYPAAARALLYSHRVHNRQGLEDVVSEAPCGLI